jgi:SAM-dependent methyltransferase
MYGPLLAPLPAGSHVLDLGSGTGVLLSWLAQQPSIIATGVDSSPGQVEAARRSLGASSARVVLQDGLAFLRAHPATFAGIFCLDVLEHLPTLDLCLEWVEASRDALLPGGFFLGRVPNAANLTGTYGRYIDLTHHRAFTRPSLIQLLEAADLTEARVVPIRSGHATGRARLALEHALHRAVFLLCGNGLESVFTNNVCALARRRG